MQRQNLTVRLKRETIRKAKVLAARRATSVSGLVASQIESLAADEDAYMCAERQALDLIDRPFHLGGARFGHAELHDR